jgi:hypothetical protein
VNEALEKLEGQYSAQAQVVKAFVSSWKLRSCDFSPVENFFHHSQPF